MRSKEQFRELVYKRANEINVNNKKRRTMLIRSSLTLSLLLVIGGAFVYGNRYERDSVLECARGSDEKVLVECVNESEYGIYYSLDGASGLNLTAEKPKGNATLLQDSSESQSLEKINSFSYVEDFDLYRDNEGCILLEYDDKNVKHDYITSYQAIEIAEKDCTIEYTSFDLYFDPNTKFWKVVFYISGTVGGGQSVYIGNDGVVRMIVYGE